MLHSQKNGKGVQTQIYFEALIHTFENVRHVLVAHKNKDLGTYPGVDIVFSLLSDYSRIKDKNNLRLFYRDDSGSFYSMPNSVKCYVSNLIIRVTPFQKRRSLMMVAEYFGTYLSVRLFHKPTGIIYNKPTGFRIIHIRQLIVIVLDNKPKKIFG